MIASSLSEAASDEVLGSLPAAEEPPATEELSLPPQAVKETAIIAAAARAIMFFSFIVFHSPQCSTVAARPSVC